jgi:deoxyadenosine/deoxycytidine kinase
MRSWSFHLQVFFLGHRAQQYLDLAAEAQSAILDRSIYEDAYIFARALHHLGNLSERDYFSYRRVFDLVVSNLPPPDLLIYLRAPVPVLIKRIHRRGRAIEVVSHRNILPCWIPSTPIGWKLSMCVLF